MECTWTSIKTNIISASYLYQYFLRKEKERKMNNSQRDDNNNNLSRFPFPSHRPDIYGEKKFGFDLALDLTLTLSLLALALLGYYQRLTPGDLTFPFSEPNLLQPHFSTFRTKPPSTSLLHFQNPTSFVHSSFPTHAPFNLTSQVVSHNPLPILQFKHLMYHTSCLPQ